MQLTSQPFQPSPFANNNIDGYKKNSFSLYTMAVWPHDTYKFIYFSNFIIQSLYDTALAPNKGYCAKWFISLILFSGPYIEIL